MSKDCIQTCHLCKYHMQIFAYVHCTCANVNVMCAKKNYLCKCHMCKFAYVNVTCASVNVACTNVLHIQMSHVQI